MAILENAPHKDEIVKEFYQRCTPSMWEGSRVAVISSRRKILEKLHNHPDKIIAVTSKTLAQEIKQQEENEREHDLERDSQREQRFE